MKIDSLETLLLGSAAEADRAAVLVRLASGDVSGWGEAVVELAPRESEQWAAATLAFLERCVAPAVAASEVESAEALNERLNRFRGHSLAKGAVDGAWRDLAARQAGKPLWQALGASGGTVAFARPLGVRASIDELIAEIATAVQRGVGEITLKLSPGWGIDVVRAVRGAFGSLAIRVDFDGTATLEQRDLLFRLQDYQVAAIEQPLDADDLVGHAMLQESLRTPVCLDQSITSPARASMALDLGSCQEMRLRADYSGGLTAAAAIHASCRAAGAKCVVGSRAATDIGLRHAAALAMLVGAATPVEWDGELADDAAAHARDIAPWNEAGIGVEIQAAELRSQAVASHCVEARE